MSNHDEPNARACQIQGPTKPRVFSQVWRDVSTGIETRRWHVEFEDSCGCREEEDFASATTANRFAQHVAGGGSRWEFVA